MDHGNSVIITQTPLSCGEDNLIIKDEKSGKSIRSGVAYNRGTTVDSGSKGRSREERHGSAHTQHRGERDSKAGGEKLLDRSDKGSHPGAHPESRKGGSENIRPASEERESWVDPYISPPLCRPKYSYRESMDKEDGVDKHHHHERKRYPSPESLTEPSYHTAQILLSSAEPKGNHSKHRGADKTPRSEARDSNRKRSESRQSPNVHLYMSELAPPSLETKMFAPTPHQDSRAPGEHKRRSRRSSAKEDSGTGNSAHTVRAAEEEMADGRDDDKVKVVSDAPGNRGAAEVVGTRGRSREDKGCIIAHRGERDSKGGGEKADDRWEISLPGDPPECRQGGPEKHKMTSSEDRDVSESSSINPSSRRPKYSYRASLEKGETRGDLEKRAGPHCMPAEPNLRTSQKMEYTVMSNVISPEVRRKHLKHHKSSLPKEQQQANGEEEAAAAKDQSGLQPDQGLQGSAEPDLAAPSKTHHPKPPPAAEQMPSGVGDVPLQPEQLARKARKSSRDNKGAVAASASPESCKVQDSGTAAASNGEGNAVKGLDSWGKRVSPELQPEAKHGVGPPEAEKRENSQGNRPPNSRRPRYSYGTNIDMEDEGFYPLNKSISSYSQWPVDSVLRVTKSEYMVASSSSSPVSNRKLIKYTSCLAEQPSTLSNFINKAKQLEIATSMQPVSAYGLPSKPFPLGPAGPTKGGPRGMCNGADMDGASLTRKESDPGVQVELCATHPQARRRRESQRGVYCKPLLHHLPDGDTDRGREETSPADVKLVSTHSNISLRHRAAPSLGMTLTDGNMCVDIPRPIVSASRSNLAGMSPYGNEIVSSKIWTKCGHFKQQHQECQKRSLQTRKRYQEEVKAALMIQAAWKGYQTRAQIRKQAEAAVIIQAAYRGYQIRKFLTDGMGVNATDELNEAQDGHWQDSEYPEIFLEEISHSDYSESEPDSGDDWLDSPVSVIVGSPGSCGADIASREDPPPVEVYSPTPVLQYESVYQSQRCNWGEV